ncbi:MAG: TIGR04255 family protein [Bythopirellula sp.]|nr:TIGR04255 family protein [Bythopirellula sp.]
MVFADSPRVIYANNTLSEVVCELRFPPILKIESAPPADFQEAIRHAFPLFEQKRKGPELPSELPPEIARMISAEIPAMGATTYEFVSDDGLWKVTLAKQSLSVRTRKYLRWEDFKAHTNAPFEALEKVYKPPFFQRIGLKYQNIISRSALKIDAEKPWSELLKDVVVGEIADPQIGARVKTTMRHTGIELENDSFVKLTHYLAKAQSSDKTPDEEVYVVDADFLTRKRTEIKDVHDRLDRLNNESGRLFRWCITDYLHTAMGPTVVE